MKLVKFKMTGLTCEGCTCGHCGKPILIFLRCLDGIFNVLPNFIEDTVDIEYDHQTTSAQEIIKLVRQRGYSIEEI